MARRADRALCRGNAGRRGHALTRFSSIGARGSCGFALRIGAVSIWRPRCRATARQTSSRRRLFRLRLRIRPIGALSSGSSCNVAALRTARRRGAFRCRTALRAALAGARAVHQPAARVAAVVRARSTSARIAAGGRGVRRLFSLRSRRALAARRTRIRRCARLLHGALRTGSGCRRRRAANSRTAGSGGISLRRRNRRSSRASSRRAPSRGTRCASVRAARRRTGTGGVASRRFVDQAVDCASGGSLCGRRVCLRRDLSAALLVASAPRTGADADRRARRRASALVSRDRNDARRSLRRRATFVYREINATGCTSGAGALRNHVLPCGCGARRDSARSGAFRS